MGVSKVLFGSTTLIDLTGDTVDAESLLDGYTAHNAAGELVVGSYRVTIEPICYDYLPGYVSTNVWNYQNSTNNHSDIYEVQADHRYVLVYGKTTGTRFRAVVVPTNPVGFVGTTISGTQISNVTNPTSMQTATFTSSIDGYLAVTKDNVSTAGLKTYLIDLTELVD